MTVCIYNDKVRNEYQYPDDYSREEKTQSEFDDTQLIRTSISNNNIQEKNQRVIFPEEDEKSNREAKSLMYKNMPSFFPQVTFNDNILKTSK